MAHTRTKDAATIAGYLGGGEKFDLALGDFAVAYADTVTAVVAIPDTALPITSV